MRVSSLSAYLTTSNGLGSALSRVQDAQAKVASGKVLTRWSDDPSAAAAAERYRSQEADWTTFGKAASDGTSWLSAADGALQSMSTIMIRIKQLGVSATSGSLTPDSREAIATELDQLKDELRDLGNTTHLGRALFGGFGTTALATDSSGNVTYSGDGGQVMRQVSPTMTVQINVTAQDVFGFNAGAGQDLFSQISALSAATRSGNTAGIAAAQTTLETRHGDILKGLSVVGAATNRIQTAQTAGSQAAEDLASRRSDVEDVDMADAVMKLSTAQAGYTAALGAASRANLPSLADFLR